MDINATLIIQAFNFLIAYYILKRLVFVPSVTIVLHERAQDAQAQGRIVGSEKKVAAEVALLKTEWTTCHESLVAKVPQLPSELFVFRGIKPAISASDLPERVDVKKTQEDIAWALIKSVRDAQ